MIAKMSLLRLTLPTTFMCLLSTSAVLGQEVAVGEAPPTRFPAVDLSQGPPVSRLSDSGLFQNGRPADGLLPYSVNAQLWSDGAYKTRFLALPGDGQVEFRHDGAWGFPDHTVLIKNFYLEFEAGDSTSRRIVETRLFVKEPDTPEWRGFSYRWDDDGQDAVLLEDELVVVFDLRDGEDVRQQDYFFPAAHHCTQCHTAGAGFVLGPRTGQMNREHDYEEGSENQISAWSRRGLFTEEMSIETSGLSHWSDPSDEGEPLELRARSYMAANCSHCHGHSQVYRASIDLRFDTPLEELGIIDAYGSLNVFDFEDGRIVDPGVAQNSTLLARLRTFTSSRMPPLASSVVDEEGHELLRRWIQSMGPPTSVEEIIVRPHEFGLLTSYPNPFNPAATIDFDILRAGKVEMSIYAADGQIIRQLVRRHLIAGSHRIRWDATDNAGRSVASGTYLLYLRTPDGLRRSKLTLLR